MSNYVDGNGEAIEQSFILRHIFISIAIYHLLTIPEGIVVAHFVMDRGVEAHATAVN